MTNTILTVDDMVRREVIQNVSVLFSDLLALVAHADRDVMEDVSFSDDELRDMQCRPDYEEAGRDHINSMDRDELLEALEAADVEDERDAHQRAEAASSHAAEEGLALEDWSDWWEDFLGVSDSDLRVLLITAIEADTDDAWQNFTNDHDLDPDDIEVYEHWAVSDWLERRLAEKGEITGKIAGLTLWGRCTTGQMISMDYVIQQIHAELLVAP